MDPEWLGRTGRADSGGQGGQARVRAPVGGQWLVRFEPHKEGTAIKGGGLTLSIRCPAHTWDTGGGL